MAEMKLGPNGALLYCMEYLEENCDGGGSATRGPGWGLRWARVMLDGLIGVSLLGAVLAPPPPSYSFSHKLITGWLKEQLDGFGDDDYLLFDCPGQIELYSHVPVFPAIARQLKARLDFPCSSNLSRTVLRAAGIPRAVE